MDVGYRYSILILVVGLTTLNQSPTWSDDSSKPRQPNIIFILADDLGWSELGCYGNGFNETPNLDRLAEEGVRFSQAYASAPVCSPYRAALLTGQHPARIGIVDYLRPNSANALPKETVTLPEVLSANGYATGMIGKWHLTGYAHHGAEHELRPEHHGFDWSFGCEVKSVGNGANFWPYRFREQTIPWLDISNARLGKDEYLTDRLNLEAVDFVHRNHERPFFLLLSHYAPHTILNGKSELVEKYKKKHAPGKSSRDKCYLCEDAGLGPGDPLHHWAGHHNPHLAAMLESIDHGVGMIVDAIQEHGLLNNTLIIFSSDNGGETNVTRNHPLRGGKSQLYEGGVRIPLIMKWPDVIKPSSHSTEVTQNIDFFPTLLEAAMIKPTEQQIDGKSILEHLRDIKKPINRSYIAWHYPLDQPHFLGGTSAGAIRHEQWKLIESFDSKKVELYNLQQDLSEKHDLSSHYITKAKLMREQLAQWRQSVSARIPSRPFLTSAKSLRFAEHFNGSHLSERIVYNPNWKVQHGILKRRTLDADNTRVFVKDAKYQDAIIRFDFKFSGASDIRLMTGHQGHYNTVLHLHPDQFFLQTAQDKSVPHYSMRHGECEYSFGTDDWHSVTVEFLGDQCIAHIDNDHVVSAKHPIIDQERHYLAIQVDAGEAEFDNFQWFDASSLPDDRTRRSELEAAMNRFPVTKSDAESLKILESNCHALQFLNDPAYRKLVQTIDELDQLRAQQYPDAFVTHKKRKEQINQARKDRLQSDTTYRLLIKKYNLAKQACERWLKEQEPEFADTPSNQRKQKLHEYFKKYEKHRQFIELQETAKTIETQIRDRYPQDYVSDEDISQAKKLAYSQHKGETNFIQLNKQRNEAFKNRKEYLYEKNPQLRDLQERVKSLNDPR